MLTRCEQKIMEVVLVKPFASYSVRQLSTTIKQSYALTHGAVQSLYGRKLLTMKKMGKALACQANLSADPQILALATIEHAYRFLHKAYFGFIIEELQQKLYDELYILILFGSHARGTATKTSDIDLLFVVNAEPEIERVRKKVKTVLSSTQLKVEFEIVTAAWLFQMFNEKGTVGREVLECSLVLQGAEAYYNLVREHDQKRGH